MNTAIKGKALPEVVQEKTSAFLGMYTDAYTHMGIYVACIFPKEFPFICCR